MNYIEADSSSFKYYKYMNTMCTKTVLSYKEVNRIGEV